MKSSKSLIGKKDKKDIRDFLKSENKKQSRESKEGEESSRESGSGRVPTDQAGRGKAKGLKKSGKESSTDKKARKALIKERKKESQLAFEAMVNNKGILGRLNETRTKIILTVLVPVIFMAVYGIVSYNKSSTAITNSYEANMDQTVSAVSDYLDLGLNGVQDKAVELLLSKAVSNYFVRLNKEDTLEDFNNLKALQQETMVVTQTNPFVSDVYIFANTGKPIVSNGSAPADLYDQFLESEQGQAYKEKKIKNKWIGSHPSLDKILEKDGSKYAMSIITRMTTPDGFIILDLDKKEILKSLENISAVKGSLAAIIASDGKETNTTESGDAMFTDTDFYKEAVKAGKGSGSDYVDYKGNNYLFVYKAVGDTGSMVCALIPKTEILKQVKTLKVLNIVFVAVASVVAIVIGYIIAVGIGLTIRRLMVSISKAAKGDLTVEFDTDKKDEFGVLSKSLNDMTSNMKQLIGEVYQVGAKVTQSSTELSQTSEQILTSTKGISLTIDEIEGGVVQQADDTEKCMGQMARLSDQIGQVYSNTYEIEKKATDTKSIIGEGVVTINELGEKAKATSEVTQTVIQSIEELEVKSRSINSFVGIINEIAAQTNLLSLNASIEAARAGEAGRGFAVVADEIRKLADQSVEAVSQIQDIVKDIQNKTQGTVESAKTAGEIVDSQTEALNKTVITFEKINTYVGGLVSNLDNISVGVKSIEAAKEDTLDAIRSISAVSQETAAASEEVSATANAQIGAVENLSHSATELEEDAKKLEKAIRLFKIQ